MARREQRFMLWVVLMLLASIVGRCPSGRQRRATIAGASAAAA